jgi:hypothetical protein
MRDERARMFVCNCCMIIDMRGLRARMFGNLSHDNWSAWWDQEIFVCNCYMIIDMRGLRARMFVNLLHGICVMREQECLWICYMVYAWWESKNVCEFVTW